MIWSDRLRGSSTQEMETGLGGDTVHLAEQLIELATVVEPLLVELGVLGR